MAKEPRKPYHRRRVQRPVRPIRATGQLLIGNAIGKKNIQRFAFACSTQSDVLAFLQFGKFTFVLIVKHTLNAQKIATGLQSDVWRVGDVLADGIYCAADGQHFVFVFIVG